MRVAAVQFNPIHKDKKTNIDKMAAYIEKTDAELLVFPELCTTGYYFSNRDEVMSIAEPKNGDTLELFKELSCKHDKIIVFGFAEKDGISLYNSSAVLFPDSKYNSIYRKTHLFYKERFCFDEGDTGFFVVNNPERDINIGTMICYDWRFPESARTLGLKGADIIVCPSALITDVWHIAMPARALENKVYLICSNRIGTEQGEDVPLLFKGSSAIYNYNGEILSKASQDKEDVIYAEIEPSRTRDKSFNEFNDIFKDRRPEFY